jgi:mono/diheme cytochrome c family protein
MTRKVFHSKCYTGLLIFGLLAILAAQLMARRPAEAARPSGADIYYLRCAVCHYSDKTEKKFGPGLKGLYTRETLITGKAVNEQNLSEFISSGVPGLMPGFRYTLDQEDIKALLGYLKTL